MQVSYCFVSNFWLIFLNGIKMCAGPPGLADAVFPPTPAICVDTPEPLCLFRWTPFSPCLSSSVLSRPRLAPDPISKTEMGLSGSYPRLVAFLRGRDINSGADGCRNLLPPQRESKGQTKPTHCLSVPQFHYPHSGGNNGSTSWGVVQYDNVGKASSLKHRMCTVKMTSLVFDSSPSLAFSR